VFSLIDNRYTLHVYYVTVFVCKVYCNTHEIWRTK